LYIPLRLFFGYVERRGYEVLQLFGGARIEGAADAEEATEVGGVTTAEGREPGKVIVVALLQAAVEVAGEARALVVQVGDELVDVDRELGGRVLRGVARAQVDAPFDAHSVQSVVKGTIHGVGEGTVDGAPVAQEAARVGWFVGFCHRVTKMWQRRPFVI
jgi:hypothetical protein